ncbi:FHA domain-containing protein [Rubinisphaera sp. JC750]|uniref:FHA domain-containing protein n=1 Tax=Rubinisphaera sp. JC750 TaxID=2898658 RepID=UPI001F37A0E0|nr:FHA domain-containing protein [Rubinisphaera sp. JC750]
MRFQDELNTLFAQAGAGTQKWLFKPLRSQSAVRGFVFSGEVSTLGSDSRCGLRVDVAGVAGMHCHLHDDDGRLLIVAEDSRTWVNDGPVRKAHLRDGDRLTIGPVTFQVETITQAADPADTTEVDLPLRDSRLVQYLNRAYDQGRLAGSPPEDMIPAPHAIARPEKVDSTVDELHRSLKATQEQLQRQQEQISRLEQEPQAEISELKREIQTAEANKQRAAISAERAKLQAERTRLESERDALTGQFEKWLRIKRKWNQRWTGQRTSVRSESDRLDKLNDELQAKADALVKQERELTTAAAEREQTRSRIQELTDRAGELETLLANAQSAEKSTEIRLHELEDQLRRAAEGDALAAELESQCETLNDRVQHLESQLNETEQLRDELRQKLEERDETLAAKNSAIEELETAAESLRSDLADCQQQLTSRNEELEQRNEQLTELRSVLEEAEADKQALSEHCQKLEERAVSENDQRQAELDAEWTRMSEERDRLLDLREQLAEQRAAFTQAHEDLRSVRSELEVEKGRFLEQQEEWTAESLRSQIVAERPIEPTEEIVATDELEDEAVTDTESPAAEGIDEESPGAVEFAEPETEVATEVVEGEQGSLETAESEMMEQVADEPSLEGTDAEEIAGGSDWNEFSFADRDESDVLDADQIETEEPAAEIADATETLEESSPVEMKEEDDEEPFQFSELRDVLLQQDAVAGQEADEQTFGTTGESLSDAPYGPDLDNTELDNTGLDSTELHEDAPLAEDDTSEEVAVDGDGDEFSSLRKELAEMFGISSGSSAAAHADETEEATEVESEEDGTSDPLGKSLFSEELTGSPDYAEPTASDESSFDAPQHGESESEEPQPYESEVSSLLDTAAFRDELRRDLSPAEMETFEDQEATTSVEETVASTSDSDDVVVDDIEDADSVAAYMKRLFARTSGSQDYSEPAAPVSRSKSTEPVASASRADSGNLADSQVESGSTPFVVDGDSSNTGPEPKRPVAQVNREQLKLEIASLRDVANQTARHALATHAWKQVKLKMMMSGALTGASAIASVVLLSSPWWSPVNHQSYGWLTVLLTAISGYELFRSHRGLVRLKQGPATPARTELPVQSLPLEENTEE